MIGSHNSLTCYRPKCFLMGAFRFLWRCQDMPFHNQIIDVDYFDIRVRYDKRKLVFCHGLVDLDVPYNLDGVMRILMNWNKKCRVILERGDDKGLMKELDKWIKIGVVQYVVVKNGWKVLYGNPCHCKDYSYVPFLSNKSFWWNIRHMKWSTIKKWSKKHNPVITDTLKKDSIIHFMDYVKVNKK